MNAADYRFLGFATGVLVLGWLLRGIVSRRYSFYWFMIWNMVLAFLPVLAILLIKDMGGESLLFDLAVSAVWLLLLPNTFYLLTDFLHLNPGVLVNKRDNEADPGTQYIRGDAWYIVDSLLLFLTTVFATVAGGFALHGYYQFLDQHYSALLWPVMAIVIIACSAGLYIGRFGRWNSWDALIRPQKIFFDFFDMFRSGDERKRLLIVMLTIIVFELFSWAAFVYLAS